MTSQVEKQASILKECLGSLRFWKELIDTHLEGEEKQAETAELEELVKEYCLIDFNASNTNEACQEVVDYFNDDSTNQEVDVEELYKEKLANKQTSFAGNYQELRIWKEVFMGVRDYDVEEVERDNASQVDTVYEELQDSISISNVFTPPVDPISKTVIREPYKNKICGHVYEQEFIRNYIKLMKNKAKCPYIGCGNKNFSMSDLVEDKETKYKIAQYMETQSQGGSNN